MSALAKNTPIVGLINAQRVAVLKLSLADYEVLEVSTAKGIVNIHINKPFEGVEPKISVAADKTFGSCEYYGCRLYWLIDQREQNA